MSSKQEQEEPQQPNKVEIQFDDKTTDWIAELQPILGNPKQMSTPEIHPGSMEETAVFYLDTEGTEESGTFDGTIVSINRGLIDEAPLFNVVLNPYPDQTERVFLREVVGFEIDVVDRVVDFYVLSEDGQSAIFGASVWHTGEITQYPREKVGMA